MARPTTYDEAIASELLDRVQSGEPLTTLCKKTHHFPSVRTLYNWKKAYPDFGKRLEEAQDHGWDAMADDCVDIADTVLEARLEHRNQQGQITKVEIGDNVQRSKLMVATRIKILELRCNRYRQSASDDKRNKGEKLSEKLAKLRKKVGM